jgi:acyl carrier protein
MIEQYVRTFIISELGWNGSAQKLTDDYPLIEGGVVDSLGIFQLVSFVESEFGVDVDDEELVPENFGTIRSIARLVDTKRSQ